MGYATNYELEEVTSIQISKDSQQRIEMQKIYDKMLEELKQIGLNTDEFKPIMKNPFSTENKNVRSQIIKYIYDCYRENLESDEPSKWYDCNRDMCEVSLHFKNTLIKIHGEGDESGDIWDAWYLNGKYYRKDYELIAPTLDIEQMKEYKE